MLLGFDPGKDKCGVAIVQWDGTIINHQIVLSANVLREIGHLMTQYHIDMIVMGNQTTSRQWQEKIHQQLPGITLELIDESYSTLQARDRYWQIYPPNFWQQLLPSGLRQPPRAIDDIVAIILVERYLSSK
jgi:RNase H-fold protein (predicted Holliday junction resolvase)